MDNNMDDNMDNNMDDNMDNNMEELRNIEPVVDNPYREYLFNIVIEQMPVDLPLRGRQDANNIIYNAIDEIVQANPDDVNDVIPLPLNRNAQHAPELNRIYTNIRRLLGQQQAPQQIPQEESIERDPIINNTDSHRSRGGKLRKTSKKRPTRRIRRRSSKARKSRSTRRR